MITAAPKASSSNWLKISCNGLPTHKLINTSRGATNNATCRLDETAISTLSSILLRSATCTATTDGFGDFWFRGLADGANFTLTIAAPGLATKTIDGIKTEKDVNLGDIGLGR